MASAETDPTANGHHWGALVVEDETIIAGAIEDLLAEMGAATIAVARSAAEAMRLVDRVRFDVAVIDWQLGSDTAAALVHDLVAAGMAAVLVTGRHPEDVTRLLPAGVALVQKPFSDDVLAAAVRAALEARRATSPLGA